MTQDSVQLGRIEDAIHTYSRPTELKITDMRVILLYPLTRQGTYRASIADSLPAGPAEAQEQDLQLEVGEEEGKLGRRMVDGGVEHPCAMMVSCTLNDEVEIVVMQTR